MHQYYINKLKRRLNRCKIKAELLREEHSGNEMNYTYHGGWSLGYLMGQIRELEDFIDDLEEVESQKKEVRNDET